MTIQVIDQGNVTILEMKGKIMGGPDAGVLNENIHELIKNGKKKIVVNLAGVDWMNSSGLGILISALTTIRNNGGELKLASLTDKIKNLLTITKLSNVFEKYDSVSEASASFK